MPVLVLVAVILFVPVLTGLMALAENLRAGETAVQRRLLHGRLTWGLARSFGNAVWSLWLTALVLPLGAVASLRHGPRKPSGKPPVILVHGLYHNPAAWFVLRRRLARAGYTDLRCYGYPSFGRGFADIAAGLAGLMLEAAADAPGGRVLLLGHSLGGLVIRAACADERVAAGDVCRVAGVATLGTPHRGSTLAGLLGLGRLARGLAPDGAVMARMRELAPFPGPGLSLFTPTDGMVLPLSGAFLDAREAALDWTERALPATSHVGLLYSRAAAREVLAFFAARAGA